MTWLEDFWFILVALLFLGLSIFFHELGHFLAARRRGLVIKRFSIGFGPRIFGWEKNGVEYRLSAIPFGGYVALPQLVDMGRIEGGEGDDEDEEENLPKIGYADKMIVSVMGAVFNVLFALSLASVLWFFGHDVRSAELTTEVGYVAEKGPAFAAGVEPGDKLLKVDGSVVRDFLDALQHITAGSKLTDDGRRVTQLLIERDQKTIELKVFPELITNEQMRDIGIGPKEIFFVGALSEGMPAQEAGFAVGDQLWAVDGRRVHSFRGLKDYIQENADRLIAVEVRKGGEEGPIQTYNVQPVEKTMEVGDRKVTMKLIGFSPQFKTVTTYPNPFTMIFNRMNDMYLTLTSLINPQSDVKVRNMSGPVGIVKHLSLFARIGWKKLFWFVVFINVNLAILNVMPIPVLDGGHMMFATIEKLQGKPIPFVILERTQVLFMVLIFSFMLYVTFFDVQRIFPS
jgi:regulator of sigma E protease